VYSCTTRLVIPSFRQVAGKIETQPSVDPPGTPDGSDGRSLYLSGYPAKNSRDIEAVLEQVDEKMHARRVQTQTRERSYQTFVALVKERGRDQMAKAKY